MEVSATLHIYGDSDCDGVPDNLDICPGDDTADFDNDGVPDGCDLDDDNDGITDLVEMNGINPDEDADGDCIPNWADEANGGSGDRILNVYDKDNDSVPNHRDLDSDNDGIYDVVEAKGIDLNNDGVSDDDDNNIDNTATNGIPSSALAGLNPSETTSGILDMFNLDSDADGCSDANEAYNDATADGGDDGQYGSYPISINPNGTVQTAVYNIGNTQLLAAITYHDDSDGDGYAGVCDTNGELTPNVLDVNESEIGYFKVYPNPADTVIIVDGSFTIDSVELYNVLGARVLSSVDSIINVSNLASGMYLLKIKSNDITETKRILIK